LYFKAKTMNKNLKAIDVLLGLFFLSIGCFSGYSFANIEKPVEYNKPSVEAMECYRAMHTFYNKEYFDKSRNVKTHITKKQPLLSDKYTQRNWHTHIILVRLRGYLKILSSLRQSKVSWGGGWANVPSSSFSSINLFRVIFSSICLDNRLFVV